MLRKVRLLFNTVRHLKAIQVFYQVYYRLRPVKNLAHYTVESKDVDFARLDFKFHVPVLDAVKQKHIFYFLNLSQRFVNEVDWDFQQYGKLWNYNLQYFNYLGQDQLDNELKVSLLLDVNKWLMSGQLKLEPYPVSLRVMNIIRYCSSNEVKNQSIINSTYLQIKYLRQHLEYHILGNHLLENAFALMMGGYAFSEQQWKKKAQELLYKELDEQILGDGGHFELSPMYHQIILFRVLELIEWYSKTDNLDPSFLMYIREKALSMLNWLKQITFKNGDIPHFNDSAIDITLSSEQLFDYAKHLGLINFPSVKLNESGYRKFEVGAYECIVDVAAIGSSYQPGHSHADALSFILYHNNRPFLVEAGTSTYQIGERRNYERSTAAHNTIEINSINQSEVWGGFRVGKRAKVNISNESPLQLLAEHDGYLHNFGVLHKRRFNFTNDDIHIVDDIGQASGIARFHFHPDCIVEVSGNDVDVKGVATISLENSDVISLEKYDYANGFNKYLEATELVVNFKNRNVISIRFHK